MTEALRYLSNAEEILKAAPHAGNTYTDMKPVREACATAYLAVLEALDEYLVRRGVPKKQLPKSADGYYAMIRKHALVHDGKLMREFDKLYCMLHVAGYYRALIKDMVVMRELFKAARQFIAMIR